MSAPLRVECHAHLDRPNLFSNTIQMKERLLILGGAGFVGSSLAVGLKINNPNREIVCFDNLRRRGSELNLSRLRHHGVLFVHGDIRCPTDLDVGTIGSPQVIIDCSAEPAVLAGVTSPEYVLQTNLGGTINVLELCRRISARMLFLSTSRVYSIAAINRLNLTEQTTRYSLSPAQTEPGVSQDGISEEFSTRGSRSLYGTTKLASELLIEEYRASFGVGAIVNRCGVLTGPWQMGKVDQGVFVLWMAAHYFRKRLEYIGFGGMGKQVRDLLHVEDLLSLIEHQLGNFDALDGELFNVGGGPECSLSLLETTLLCREISGRQTEVGRSAQDRPADIALFITDNHRVTTKTGWVPKRTPRSTLQDIFDWIQQNETILGSVLS